jgi:hypothetical protein
MAASDRSKFAAHPNSRAIADLPWNASRATRGNAARPVDTGARSWACGALNSADRQEQLHAVTRWKRHAWRVLRKQCR